MGLDMWFLRLPKGATAANLSDYIEVRYFRKHSDLHGWMEERWKEQGNEKEFNCEFLEITPGILAMLEEYLKVPAKKKYIGFFWGESKPEDWEATSALIPKLKAIIAAGDRVFYRAWY